MDTDQLNGLPIGNLVNPTPAAAPALVNLSGRYVRLETLNVSTHGDALWQVVGGKHNHALWQYMSEGPFDTRPEFDDALRQAAAQRDPAFFAIIDLQTGVATGRCAFLNIRPGHKVVEVGHILFSQTLQRTPAATEALYLLAQYAFDQLGYRRYEWKCNSLNAASRRAAARLGFQFEGIFRQHMIIKGRNRDTAWFSILDKDWPLIKAAMEHWLSPGNFDENGRQQRRLSDFMPILNTRSSEFDWRL